MPAVALLLFLSCPGLAGAQSAASAWPQPLSPVLKAGIEAARVQGKPLLLAFGAEWCGPCKAMNRKVFPHPKVASAMEHWLLVRIDADEHRDLARAFSVSALPTYIAISDQGEERGRKMGLQLAFDFADWLNALVTESKLSE